MWPSKQTPPFCLLLTALLLNSKRSLPTCEQTVAKICSKALDGLRIALLTSAHLELAFRNAFDSLVSLPCLCSSEPNAFATPSVRQSKGVITCPATSSDLHPQDCRDSHPSNYLSV